MTIQPDVPVAIATCSGVPDLDADAPVLLTALLREGIRAEVRVWDDSTVDWSAYRLVLIRSVWDYFLRHQKFVEWTQRCRRTSNPAAILAWSSDKRYLLDLEQAGVPVVPTAFFGPGHALDVPAAWQAGDVVIKPTVSGAAADTARFLPSDDGLRRLAEHVHGQGRSVMVQPYLPKVEEQGETSLVFLGGQFSHAFRKAALLTGSGTREPLMGDAALAAITAATATAQELEVAHQALAAIPCGPQSLTYARVDLIPDGHGQAVVLELELTEPSLFLRFARPDAVQRFAAAVSAQARA